MKIHLPPKPAKQALEVICIFISWIALTSCGETGYYYQAVKGQVSLVINREPVNRLLRSPDTPEALKERLRLVARIKRFAVKELLLPDNNSFTSLVHVPEKYVIWNVYAVPELSTKPEKWCFPIAGCVNYRGYFSKKRAELYGGKYSAKGFDVYIGGAAAFSTLGFFNDPLFSTFLNWPEESLAGLIFHELAHAKIYVKDDSSFNESFAMTVENEGIKRWLEGEGKQERFRKFLKGGKHQEQFEKLMLETRKALKQVYSSTSSDSDKRVNKKRIIKKAQDEYAKLKAKWRDDNRWDSWVNKGLNNAKLASIATYGSLVPVLTKILNESKNIEEFYKTVKELAGQPKVKRHERLKRKMGQTQI